MRARGATGTAGKAPAAEGTQREPRASDRGGVAPALAAAAAAVAAATAASAGAVWWFGTADFGPPLSSPLRAQARVSAGLGGTFGTPDMDTSR